MADTIPTAVPAEIRLATDRGTTLYCKKAATVTGALKENAGRNMSWVGNGALAWKLSVPADGFYELYLTADVREEAEAGVFSFRTVGKKYDLRLAPTTGTKIGGRSFERVRLATDIALTAGRQSVEFLTENVSVERPLLDFCSLELLPTSARDAIAAESARAVAARASADWLHEAGYGVMFHWTSQSVQRDGSTKPYAEAVEEFDVVRFADMAEATGAGYVMLTIGHAESYCPAPITSWERCHPGKTTRRDLIEEIARELAKKNVRLICYINGPLGFGLDVNRKSSEGEREAFVHNFEAILGEMGERYQGRVAGYWFDSWYQIAEEFPDVPFESFFQAAKTGYPDRIICLNSWIYPPVTPWQDYWAGEVGGPVDVPVNGYLTSGPVTNLPYQALLIMEPYWVQKQAAMPPPRFASDDLSRYIIDCRRNKGAVTINLGIYQDGTVGAQALQVMKEVREKVNGENRARR